jgi:glutamate racemase
VVDRFADGVTVIPQTVPGLVEQIEAGELDSPETREILRRALRPVLDSHADTLVLGCTHYPFIIPLLQELAGEGVEVINPSPAIARQTRNLLKENELLAGDDQSGKVTVYSSAIHPQLDTMLSLVGLMSAEIHAVQWLGDSIVPID